MVAEKKKGKGTPKIPAHNGGKADPYAHLMKEDTATPTERIMAELNRADGGAVDSLPPKDGSGDGSGGESGDQGNSFRAFTGFLDRLRGGILATLVLLFALTVAGFFFSDYILHVINLPFLESGHRLNIFTVTGGFMIRIKASFGAAVLVAFPFFVHRIWRVVLPSIPRDTRMFSRISVFGGVLLFYSGIAFVYFLLMPAAVKILLDFIGGSMASTIGADDYLTFTVLFSLAMGVLFDTPIIVMLLTYFGLVTPKMLSKYRRHAIVLIWIIAALITPTPDPITQSMVAVPLMGFYELSILGSRIVVRRKARAAERWNKE